jgi:predicted dehydrogenase
MKAPVPIAVIGLGFMGGRWARAVAEHAGAELRVVSDLREDLGKELAQDYGAVYVGDAGEAATHREVSGVVVVTPEHAHVDPALAAIRAGKVTAVDKPLAHTVEDAERIRDEARSKGVPVLTGHILRFEPRYAAMRKTIEEGRIGAVQAIRSERIGVVGDQRVLRGRTTIPLYYGVHEFDLARWYAGDVKRISAERSAGVLQSRGFDIHDLYSAVLRFDSGAHGTTMLGWCLPDGTAGWGRSGFTVIGETGMLRVDQADVGLTMVGEGGLIVEDTYFSPIIHGRFGGALANEVDHFVRCVLGETEPLCTADDGAEAVRVSLAMEQSAEKGEPVILEAS